MYERLTRRDKKGVVYAPAGKPPSYVEFTGISADRLAQYEDSGLSPEEVQKLKQVIKEIGEGVSEIHGIVAQAKADGRLVVLPCKVGDEIFSFRWSAKNEKYEVHTGKVKNVRCDSLDGLVMVSDGERYCVFGKTVFLTREAAEKALGGGEEREDEDGSSKDE